MKTPSGVPLVPALDAADQDLVRGLMAQLARKAWRNRVRRNYYDLHQSLKDFGIALPKQMKHVEIALGWPAKGVDELCKRTVLDGFTHPEADVEGLGVGEVWTLNHLETQFPQALVESAICSVAFCSLTAGDVDAGEPPELWSFRSGEFATGTWDPRTYGLKNALTVFETDNTGGVVDFALYVPDRVVCCRRQGRTWDVREVRHELGVPVEPLVYRQRLQRPFGSSRISRAVMYLTDAGIRTALRSEVAYEYFSAPQRYVLGVTEDAFHDEDGNWQEAAFESIIGRILALTRDENGDLPTVGAFPQITAEPNMAALRTITQLLAAELNMPVSAFGIVQDNPASAEA
ncbi:MAG: hypothetical protein LBE08_02290, partial [Bifidobacteriaceae bacterium]|nr:hypothetical protein [Bifidobacteriaceae bacterium]